jgi:hypothetical protein
MFGFLDNSIIGGGAELGIPYWNPRGEAGYTIGEELFPNPSFETAGAGGVDVLSWWGETIDLGGDIIQDDVNYSNDGGSKSVKLIAGTVDRSFLYTPNITVKASGNYLLAFDMKGDGGATSGFYMLYDATHAATIDNYIDLRYSTAQWKRKYINIYIPAGCTEISLLIFSPLGNGRYVNIDNASFKEWVPPTMLEDNFNREDGDPWVGPKGFGYTDSLITAYGYPQIVNKKLVSPMPDGVAPRGSYLCATLPGTTKKLEVGFSWSSKGSDIGGSVVFGISPQHIALATLSNFLHFYSTSIQWDFSYFDAGGVYHALGYGEYANPLVASVNYKMSIEITGNTLVATLPSGQTVTYTDLAIGANNGRYIFYEMYRNNANEKLGEFSGVKATWV